MRVIDLALKDLSQIVRDRKSALFLVLMPILFTFFFGSLFSASEGDARLPVGWLDRDGGALTTRLRAMVETSEALRLVVVSENEAASLDARVRDEELAAALIVPAGFTAQTLAGTDVPLTVIVPSTPAGQTANTALQAMVMRLLGTLQTARLSADAYAARQSFASGGARQAYFEDAIRLASDAWQQPPLTMTAEPATSTGKAESRNAFTQASPGMIVQFAVFSLATSAMVLVLERKSKVLDRLLTTPIRRAEVIGGHMLAMFVVVFFQEAMLVALGQLLFQVDYLREPLGTLLMMTTLALWVSSLGLFIATIARSPEQVIMWSLIAMFLFAALGGAWFPLEVAGQAFAAIGHLTPTAWAMDGFQNIVTRGLGWNSTLAPTGILLAYTAAFFGLAVWRLRFE